MSKLKISLPDTLKTYVDEQVTQRGFGATDDFVQDLIRKDQDRMQLRGLLLEGASSPAGEPTDEQYFQALRDRIK